MQTKLLIPRFNDINVVSAATAALAPETGDTLSWNSDLNNVNNSGLLFVAQLALGNVAAACEILGSIDGVNYSPLITGISFTNGGNGQQQTLAYSVTFPPYIKLKLTARAHNSDPARSGVAVWITY